MMYYEKKVEWLKERYPEGTRICLDRMNDDPFPVESGTLGNIADCASRNLQHAERLAVGESEVDELHIAATMGEHDV